MTGIFHALRLALRRRRLCAAVKHCPCCQSPQIQLQDWMEPNARWKCRACKVIWWQEASDAKPVAYCHKTPAPHEPN